MRRIEEIEHEIEALRRELESTHGTETEVYSRIVGYYRSLHNWNRGKREEFRHRVAFSDLTGSTTTEPNRFAREATPVRFELFIRASCPNCPPMKTAAERLDIPGTTIDVDTQAGALRASELAIYATPTIVFFGADDEETHRRTSASAIGRVVPAV